MEEGLWPGDHERERGHVLKTASGLSNKEITRKGERGGCSKRGLVQALRSHKTGPLKRRERQEQGRAMEG